MKKKASKLFNDKSRHFNLTFCDDTDMKIPFDVNISECKLVGDLKKQIGEIIHMKSDTFYISNYNENNETKTIRDKGDIKIIFNKTNTDVHFLFPGEEKGKIIKKCDKLQFNQIIEKFRKFNFYFSDKCSKKNLYLTIFGIKIKTNNLKLNYVPEGKNINVSFDEKSIRIDFNGKKFIFEAGELISKSEEFIQKMLKIPAVSICSENTEIKDKKELIQNEKYSISTMFSYKFIDQDEKAHDHKLEVNATVLDAKNYLAIIYETTPNNIIIFDKNTKANNSKKLRELDEIHFDIIAEQKAKINDIPRQAKPKPTPKIPEINPAGSRSTTPLANQKPASPKATTPLANQKPASPKATTPLANQKPAAPKATTPLANQKPAAPKATIPSANQKPAGSRPTTPSANQKSAAPKATIPSANQKPGGSRPTTPSANQKPGGSRPTTPSTNQKPGGSRPTTPSTNQKPASPKATTPSANQKPAGSKAITPSTGSKPATLSATQKSKTPAKPTSPSKPIKTPKVDTKLADEKVEKREEEPEPKHKVKPPRVTISTAPAKNDDDDNSSGSASYIEIYFIFEESTGKTIKPPKHKIDPDTTINELSSMISKQYGIPEIIEIKYKEGDEKVTVDKEMTIDDIREEMIQKEKERSKNVLYIGHKEQKPSSEKPTKEKPKVVYKPKTSSPKSESESESDSDSDVRDFSAQDHYLFEFDEDERDFLLKKESFLSDHIDFIKQKYHINESDEIGFKIANDNDDNEDEENDGEIITNMDQPMKNFEDQKIIVYLTSEDAASIYLTVKRMKDKKAIIKQYSYMTNVDDQRREVDLDTKATVKSLKRAIHRIKKFKNSRLADMKVLFAGKDLLDDLVLDKLNIGNALLYVYIRSTDDILLMTAKALRVDNNDDDDESDDYD